MEYRREVDGLRAFAVFPVILFHAGVPSFEGGFVGVDIFFVISGYLITSIILAEKQSGTFTLTNFYERRARRILPGLFLVMFACLPFVWLFPDDTKKFSESLVAVSIFASNFYFWKDTIYFGAPSELKPLLHTWSLAVEEQYYLLFPIFILLTWRLGKRRILVLLALIALISLGTAQWASINKPAGNFFLLPTRGWEILIGAFLAFHLSTRDAERNNIIGSHAVSQLGSIVGIMLCIYAVSSFDRQTPFPGFYTLIPTTGAALIILFATQRTLVGKLLGSKLFVGVGLISYSLYLWHQPLLALSRIRSLVELSNIWLAMLGVVTVVLAYLSWKYVEIPFRNKHRFSRKQIFVYSSLCSGFFISVGSAGYFSNGFEDLYQQGLTSSQKEIFSFSKMDVGHVYRDGKCYLQPHQSFEEFSVECRDIVKEDPTLLIWGDSHAAALSKGLREVHKNVIQYTASACPPIVGLVLFSFPHCARINDFVIREIGRIRPTEIFLHANWHTYYMTRNPTKGLRATIAEIRMVSPESHITIVGGVPQYLPSLPKAMLMTGMTLDKIGYLRTPLYEELILVDKELEQVAHVEAVEFLSAIESLCRGDRCQVSVSFDNILMPMTYDYGHLTEGGSMLLAAKLIEKIRTASQ